MPQYKIPGVYVKVSSPDDHTIARVAETATVFVGPARAGPIAQVVRVVSFQEYLQAFGEVADVNDVLGLAVRAYFENGGQTGAICRLAGVGNRKPTAGTYEQFYREILSREKDISSIVVPGVSWPADGSGNAILEATLAHCEAMRDRVLIMDIAKGVILDSLNTVTGLNLPISSYAAVYHPWLKVDNPLYSRGSRKRKRLLIAPSAAVAGVWSRFDNLSELWKAPAGIEADLRNIVDLEYTISNANQGILNPRGINCIRSLAGHGIVIWGSRTLAGPADQVFHYISVRRLAIFIEQSVQNGTRYAVFEPNNEPLWASLRSQVDAFMEQLFRAGALQGAKTDQAYFVRCGLNETMSRVDIDNGRIIIEVGFAPLKPAEFVIIRIEQKARSLAG